MKNEGKVFEADIKKSIDEDLAYFIRLLDQPSAYGAEGTITRFTPKNPYDCIMFYNRSFFAIELKSTKSTSFSFQKSKEEMGKQIKLHQIKELEKTLKYDYCFGGFIFNFRENNNHTYWMSIQNFLKFYNSTVKKSINEQDIVDFGAFKINNTIKKVHYKYDILYLCEQIIENYEKEREVRNG